MLYLKNKKTGEIKEAQEDDYFKLSKNFRNDYDLATDEEANSFIIDKNKLTKKQEIETARKEEQYSNITYDGKEFLNTATAQNKFFHLLSATDGDVNWRTASNKWVKLTRVKANELRDAIINKEVLVYKKESDKLNELELAKTIEEIENIKWN